MAPFIDKWWKTNLLAGIESLHWEERSWNQPPAGVNPKAQSFSVFVWSWLCWWRLATVSPSECGDRNRGCRQFQPHSCSSLTLDQANGASCGFPENDSGPWWACLGCLSLLDSSLWFKGWQCDWQAHQNVMEQRTGKGQRRECPATRSQADRYLTGSKWTLSIVVTDFGK